MSKKFGIIIPDKGLTYSSTGHSRSAELYFAGTVVLALAFFVLSWLVFTNMLISFDTAAEEAISSWNFKGLHTLFEFVADNKTLIANTIMAVIALCF